MFKNNEWLCSIPSTFITGIILLQLYQNLYLFFYYNFKIIKLFYTWIFF